MTRTQPEGDPAETVSSAETLFLLSEHEAAFRALIDLDLAALPLDLLDRALPVLLMTGEATAGEAYALTLLDAIERRIPDHSRGIGAVVMTYRSEATAEPRLRAGLATRALEMLPETGAPIARHRALAVLLSAKVDLAQGLDEGLLGQMTEVERRIDLVAAVDSAEAQRGFLAYQVGRLEESRTALGILRNQARLDGHPFIERIFATHIATVDVFAGRLAAARELLATHGDPADDPHPPSPAVARVLGLIALREADDAALQSVLLQPTLQGSEAHGALARKSLTGLAAARREEWREAHRQLSRALARAEALGLKEPGRRMWIDFDLARAAIGIGRPDEAAGIAERLERISADTRPLLDGVAARLRGLIARPDDIARSITLLEESVAALAGAGFPDQLALSLLELGRTLTTAGRLDDARRALERAQVLTGRTGDTAIGRLVDRALTSASSDALLAELTPRERQIARAAARGASSREIAAADFTSARTVETQLSSIYRKLGIGSRAQLMALLADELRDERTRRFT